VKHSRFRQLQKEPVVMPWVTVLTVVDVWVAAVLTADMRGGQGRALTARALACISGAAMVTSGVF
jgi:hypothetical protein